MFLQTLEKMLDMDFDSGSLEEDISVVDHEAAKVIDQNPQLREHIASLEESYDITSQVTTDERVARRMLQFLEKPSDAI